MSPPIRILVVDDSAVFRMVLARVLGRTDGMEVIGVAADGLEALEAAHRLDPDVITLDVEMPGLDGLETLRRLLAERPTRVVMLSRATKAGAEVTLDALKAGATDAIAKPDEAWGSGPNPFVDDLLAKIRAAALVPRTQVLATPRPETGSVETRPVSHPPAIRRHRTSQGARGLVVVATSTGGPRALETLLSQLPIGLGAGLVVVQHMLTGFTATLAERLDRVGPLAVREATAGIAARGRPDPHRNGGSTRARGRGGSRDARRVAARQRRAAGRRCHVARGRTRLGRSAAVGRPHRDGP